MNKRELIKHIEDLPCNEGLIVDTIKISRNGLLKLIEQLDEPKKVKVSEEEAKFLETFDFDRDSDITKALYYVSRAGWGHLITDNNNVEMKDLTEDVVFFVKNRKRLIKAILFGYEVEKEKRYRVKIIQTGQHLAKNIFPKSEYFVIKTSAISSTDSFTRKELEEAGFGWVFDCEGIEIEEVEE
jgi:gp192